MLSFFCTLSAHAGDNLSGEQVYRQQCVRCHGKAGEGTEDYPRALAGDRSVAQLSKLIAKTMPEDDPGTCTGDDADKVAGYIHEAFYSKAARERNKPPRVELSRLTVRQYRNAVTDLIGSFRTAGTWDGENGLHAEYFKSRRFRPADRLIERRDPEVRFDFGESSPEPENIDPQEFSIRWDGSVLAPDTGDYEFIVRTGQAARLWVNDMKRPLIDGIVRSANDDEVRASIRLLGGRAYPIRLEFFKAKQGVDDSKKKNKPKLKIVNASIALLWKTPLGTSEVVPRHLLTPNKFPESLVVETPFPPDDRSIGYERGTSVSKAWDQATTDAAIEVAGAVVAKLREFTGGADDPKEREKAAREFCSKLAERAFRRPLTDDQKRIYIDRQFTESGNTDLAVKRAVMLVLKSPRFLYHEIDDGVADGYDTASRLSFGLWDSLPDAKLLEAAAAGKLATREEIVAQAERMATDLRTRSKLRDFFLHWLRVDRAPEIAKDPEKFPGFDSTVVSDLRTSLELFLDDVIWGPSSDFRQLLSSDTTYLNGRLAKYYGADLPPDAPFQKVKLQPEERAGVLSHPYLMATFSYTAATSPIHRGVFLARSVLGRSLKPPPVAVSPLAPDLHAGLTTRERVTLQTSPVACTSCHNMINPLGFALERFDAVGRFRAEEKAKPVDASGSYQTREGGTSTFTGARELAAFLSGSEETHAAFVEQLFHHLAKQPVRAYGPRLPDDLKRSFTSNRFHIRKLMTEIMAASAPATAATKLAETR